MQSESCKIAADVLFPMLESVLLEGKEVSFTITGNSMWPLLFHGRDTVILEHVDPEDLHVGDMILFRTPLGNYMFHRISKISGNMFETIGDGNCFRDGLFPRDCVIGRAVKVIRKGKVIEVKKLRWRLVFGAWIWLFPVRRKLLQLMTRARTRTGTRKGTDPRH